MIEMLEVRGGLEINIQPKNQLAGHREGQAATTVWIIRSHFAESEIVAHGTIHPQASDTNPAGKCRWNGITQGDVFDLQERAIYIIEGAHVRAVLGLILIRARVRVGWVFWRPVINQWAVFTTVNFVVAAGFAANG